MTRGPRTTRKSPRRAASGSRSAGRLQREIDKTVKREIMAALSETGGNVTHAAKSLGISRIALRARMNALGIDAPKR